MTLAEEDAPDSAAEEKLSKSNTGKNTGRRIPYFMVRSEGGKFNMEASGFLVVSVYSIIYPQTAS